MSKDTPILTPSVELNVWRLKPVLDAIVNEDGLEHLSKHLNLTTFTIRSILLHDYSKPFLVSEKVLNKLIKGLNLDREITIEITPINTVKYLKLDVLHKLVYEDHKDKTVNEISDMLDISMELLSMILGLNKDMKYAISDYLLGNLRLGFDKKEDELVDIVGV